MGAPILARHVDGGPLRVLVTGAGGPAGVGALLALADQADCYAVDIDPAAAGLYLVDPDRAALIPRGDDPDLIESLLRLCTAHAIDVLIPTVDSELAPVAADIERFAKAGTRVLVAPFAAITTCLDKAALTIALESTVPVPATIIVTSSTTADDLSVPLASAPGQPRWMAKPRTGAGGRGITQIHEASDLDQVPHDGSFLLCAYLPGEEYSVDVLVSRSGQVIAAVPRSRQKLDSGVAVATRVLDSPELSALAGDAALAIGLTGIANVQFRRDDAGIPRLLEINPRLSGSLAAAALAGAPLIPWAVADLLDQPLPGHLTHQPTQVVRYLTEVIADADAYDALTDAVPPAISPALEDDTALDLDLSQDWHTHTTWSDGTGSARASVAAAEARGLTRLSITDHVRSSSDWLEAYVAELAGLAADTPVTLVIGVEAKMLDTEGTLDLPDLPEEVTQVNIADHQFPTPAGPATPRAIRERIEAGTLAPETAMGWLVTATTRAMARCPRSVVVAHLFSILPKAGLHVDEITTAHLDQLATAAQAVGAVIEVNEKWTTPARAQLVGLAERGVHLVASTDAHCPEAVGDYHYVATVGHVCSHALAESLGGH